MRAHPVVLVSLFGLGLSACGKSSDDTASDLPFDVAASDKDRDLDPDYSSDDMDALVSGNTDFAVDMYHYFASTESGGFFYSPFSMSIALAMTWAGARGDTETQMADALHFTLDQAHLHPTFDGLDLAIGNRADDAEDMEIPFTLAIANSIWGQVGYEFVPDFLDVMAVDYGAGLNLLDFAADPEAARTTINDWVAEQTHDRIEDLIPAGAVSALTRLVLTNAIYFMGAWDSPFEEEYTADGPFTTIDGSTVTVPMMNQYADFPVVQGDGFDAIELPYDGEVFSMLVVVPDEGQFSSFEASLDGAVLDGIIASLSEGFVELTLPKFHCESSFLLRDALESLGMIDAFDSLKADFTGIEPTGELYVSSVIHKSWITVDEAGTEAAAATAVVMDGGSGDEPGRITVDRPFLYAILDRETGTVLFMGRVTDPSR